MEHPHRPQGPQASLGPTQLAELAAQPARCAAPRRRSFDGRCPNLVPDDAPEHTIYCSNRCKHRAYRYRLRNPAPTREDRIIGALQAARAQDGQPALAVHPVLRALAVQRAGELLLAAAEKEHPAWRGTPRYVAGPVHAQDLADPQPLVKDLSRHTQVGVAVVPLGDRCLVVTVLS